MENSNKPFEPLNNGFGIQPIGKSPLDIGDMHDIFKINEHGDISEGHTTVRIPGGQNIHMPWNPRQ